MLTLLLASVMTSAIVVKNVKSNPSTTIYVHPPTKTAYLSNTFTVDINIADLTYVDDLVAWSIILEWNSSLLELVSVSKGSFCENWTSWIVQENQTSGQLWALSNDPDRGIYGGLMGSGTLAQVRFRAIALGQCNLTLTATSLVTAWWEPFTGPPWLGDANGDMTVDETDLGIVLDAIGLKPYNASADFMYDGVKDGRIDAYDYWCVRIHKFPRDYIHDPTTDEPQIISQWEVYNGTVEVEASTLVGDVNGDGTVDMADLALMIYWYMTTPPNWNPNCDVNGDLTIDMADISMAIDGFMATGDSTKNVNVTNWPVQSELFPENLVLRATIGVRLGGDYPHMLLDETTPYPSPDSSGGDFYRRDYDYVSVGLNNVSQLIYNQTYVYMKMPTRSYAISGYPQVSLSYNVTNSPATMFYIYMYAYLGKVSISGQYTDLLSIGSTGWGYGSAFTDLNSKVWVQSSFAPVISIAANERLAIRVMAYAYTTSGVTNLTYKLLCGMNTNDFLVDIPIVKNP